jgi:hypothetical protein
MINQYEDKRKELFLEKYLENWCKIEQTCAEVGISSGTYRKWKREDMFFNEDCEETKSYIHQLKSRGLNRSKVQFN